MFGYVIKMTLRHSLWLESLCKKRGLSRLFTTSFLNVIRVESIPWLESRYHCTLNIDRSFAVLDKKTQSGARDQFQINIKKRLWLRLVHIKNRWKHSTWHIYSTALIGNHWSFKIIFVFTDFWCTSQRLWWKHATMSDMRLRWRANKTALLSLIKLPNEAVRALKYDKTKTNILFYAQI